MLKLLLKGIDTYQSLLNQTKAVSLSPKGAATFKTIKAVYQQQKHHLDNPKAKIKDRIVSIYNRIAEATLHQTYRQRKREQACGIRYQSS